MSEVMKMYEQFVTEENQLCRRIGTLDIIQSYILLAVHKETHHLDMTIVEDVLMSMQRIHQDMLTELVHIRLEKSVLSNRHHSNDLRDEE